VPSTIVAIENLTKSFALGRYVRRLVKNGARRRGPSPEVLKGVNLLVYEGEVLGLFGAKNGAGKTTLVEILATLLLPTSGRSPSLRPRCREGRRGSQESCELLCQAPPKNFYHPV